MVCLAPHFALSGRSTRVIASRQTVPTSTVLSTSCFRPASRETVVLRALALVGRVPLRRQRFLALESVERGVERAGVDTRTSSDVVARMCLGDPVSVRGARGGGSEG